MNIRKRYVRLTKKRKLYSDNHSTFPVGRTTLHGITVYVGIKCLLWSLEYLKMYLSTWGGPSMIRLSCLVQKIRDCCLVLMEVLLSPPFQLEAINCDNLNKHPVFPHVIFSAWSSSPSSNCLYFLSFPSTPECHTHLQTCGAPPLDLKNKHLARFFFFFSFFLLL